MSGILLAPLDDTALRGPVASAVRGGIPVVAFDSKLDSTDHLSLVETDNDASGRLAGDHIARLLGGKGTLVKVLAGALLMTKTKTGCTHAGLSPWLQEMITGGIIVVAVALDRFRHRGSVTDGQ